MRIVANPQQRKSESTGDVFQNCAPVLLSSCYLLTSVSGFGIPASRIEVTSLPVLEHTLCKSVDPTSLQSHDARFKLLSDTSQEVS